MLVLVRIWTFIMVATLTSGCQRATRYERMPQGKYPTVAQFNTLKASFEDTIRSQAKQDFVRLESRFVLLEPNERFGMPLMRAWVRKVQSLPVFVGSEEILEASHQKVFQDVRHLFANDVKPTPKVDIDSVEMDYSTWPTWSYLDSFRVLGRYRHVFTVAQVNYRYTGGAHGLTTRALYHFDLRKRRNLTLEDIIVPRQMALLHRLVQLELRADSAKAALVFDVGEVRASPQFAPEAAGLTFVYNPYEIAPYSAGAMSITVPWEALQGIVRPDFWKD
jgi:hypothetical protein